MAEQHQRPAALRGHAHADVVEMQVFQERFGHDDVFLSTEVALLDSNPVICAAVRPAHSR
jgi:hypothetical protein